MTADSALRDVSTIAQIIRPSRMNGIAGTSSARSAAMAPSTATDDADHQEDRQDRRAGGEAEGPADQADRAATST